jgi:hypothetical protein
VQEFAAAALDAVAEEVAQFAVFEMGDAADSAGSSVVAGPSRSIGRPPSKMRGTKMTHARAVKGQPDDRRRLSRQRQGQRATASIADAEGGCERDFVSEFMI